MSALALPVPAREVRGPRRGHLQLVDPSFVPVDTAAPQPATRPARAALRLTARGRLVRSLLVLVVAVGLAVAGGAWLGAAVGGESYSGPVERVSVGAGDTVWGIAAGVSAAGQDVREVVDDILQLNGLSSGELVVGQRLLVPAG